jgi:hypothetical protein
VKRLLTFAIVATIYVGASGCCLSRICPCFREAWNSRFNPPQQQQAVMYTDPCVVTDSACMPCESSCGSCAGGATLVAPVGPASPGPVQMAPVR